uniref:Uncharacterized protein n=1 Tax=Medicago truncatula TaxID=3880 RepID=Q2HUA5_MEDTR|nr:hypothetical protein MtrDRAFT_AC149206g19v2 [Medicago truncatula]
MNGRDLLQRAVFTAGDSGPFLASQYIVAVNFVKLQIQALEVRGWCPGPRQGRSSDSKSTYKGNYIYLPPKALTELEIGFSRIQDLSFYH